MRAPSSDPTFPSPPSFEELYRSTFGFVARTLRRLGVGECGLDDAIQDVYLVVHRRLDSFEGRSAPTTWVYGIARRVAADHRRREVRLPEPVDELEVAAAGDPYEELATAQGMAQLGRLLDELPEDRREVFVLAEIEELSGPEIARCLDLDVETVYWRLKKSRREWSNAVERYSARESWRAQRGSRGDRRRKRRCWTAIAVALGLPAREVAAAGATGASLGTFAASGAAVLAAVAAVVAVGSPTSHATAAAPAATTTRAVAMVAPAPSPVVEPLPSQPGASARSLPPRLATRSRALDDDALAAKPSATQRVPARSAVTVDVINNPVAAEAVAAEALATETVATEARAADAIASETVATDGRAAETVAAEAVTTEARATKAVATDAVAAETLTKDPGLTKAAGATGDLAAEAALLLEADQALRRGALEQAEHHLREHRTRFPAAVLVRERETLELARRCLAGDHDGIDAAIADLMRRHPSRSARQTLERACALGR